MFGIKRTRPYSSAHELAEEFVKAQRVVEGIQSQQCDEGGNATYRVALAHNVTHHIEGEDVEVLTPVHMLPKDMTHFVTSAMMFIHHGLRSDDALFVVKNVTVKRRSDGVDEVWIDTHRNTLHVTAA